MRKKIYLSILLLFLTIQFLVAQNSFVEGYVITSSGDTLKGFINERLAKRQSTVTFKVSQQDNDKHSQEFSTTQVVGFYLKPYDEYFVSSIVEIDKKPIEVNQLETEPTSRLSVDTIFMKVIIKGSLSLYHFREVNNKDHFFVQKGDGNIVELSLIRYLLVGKMVTREIYKEQLERLTSECPKLKANQVGYNLLSLKRFVNKFNLCQGQASNYVKKTEKVYLKPYLIGGFSMSKLVFSGQDNSPYGAHHRSSDTNFNTSSDPLVGFGIDLITRKNKPFSFNLEFVLRQNSFKGKVVTTIDESVTQIRFSYLRLNYMGKYSFKRTLNPLFLRVGFTNGLTFNETNNITVSRPSVNDVVFNDKATDLQKYDFGIVGGIGSNVKKFGFEFRYEFLEKPSRSKNSSLNTSSLSFIVTYSFR